MKITEAIEILKEIQEEGVSKNVNESLCAIIASLEDTHDLNIHKALSILDDMANDATIPSHIRTQLWSVTCLLEHCSE